MFVWEGFAAVRGQKHTGWLQHRTHSVVHSRLGKLSSQPEQEQETWSLELVSTVADPLFPL